jgi:hypothetical protein
MVKTMLNKTPRSRGANYCSEEAVMGPQNALYPYDNPTSLTLAVPSRLFVGKSVITR